MPHDELASRLRYLVSDVDRYVHEGLDLALKQAVSSVGQALPVQGAGIMLLDEHGVLTLATSTQASGQALETAQQRLGGGPAIESFRQNLPVCSADLRSDDRWPDLRYLIAPDIAAVLSVPVSLRDAGPVGILSVYSSAPRQWSVADISAVVAYSQVVTAVLDVALRAELQGELLERLARALVANPTGRSPPDEATRS